ncbi:helix-turn-helix domain-containing protein [Terasakiella pusilla]|uniref:helix-turn-helix domain-containing protein n=1 Tax=Terasakiella pusilla TaxID=64973 RepID=UPI003AA86232
MNMIATSGIRKSDSFDRRAYEYSRNWQGLLDPKERFRVIHLLRRVGHKLGFGDVHINHLEYMISRVPDKYWEPGHHPYFWKEVWKQSQELNISERQIRNRENKLIELGAIAFNGSANCRRYALYDDQREVIEAFGIDLAPMMGLLPRLVSLHEEDEKEKKVEQRLRKYIQNTRHKIRRLLAEAYERAFLGWQHYRERLEPYEGRIMPHMDLVDLQKRFLALKDLEKEVREFMWEQDQKAEDCFDQDGVIEDLDNAEGCGQSVETSGTEEIDFLHINNTTDGNSSFRSTYNPPVDSSFEQSSPNGSQEGALMQANARSAQGCLQRKTEADFRQRKQIIDAFNDPNTLTGACHVTAEQAAFVGTWKLRAQLPEFRQPNREDIIYSAENLLPKLGIGEHAWFRGTQKFGEYATALAAILTDAVFADENPPRCTPGQYLGGILRKEAQEINLHQSFFKRLAAKNYFDDENHKLGTHEGSYSAEKLPKKEMH